MLASVEHRWAPAKKVRWNEVGSWHFSWDLCFVVNSSLIAKRKLAAIHYTLKSWANYLPVHRHGWNRGFCRIAHFGGGDQTNSRYKCMDRGRDFPWTSPGSFAEHGGESCHNDSNTMGTERRWWVATLQKLETLHGRGWLDLLDLNWGSSFWRF